MAETVQGQQPWLPWPFTRELETTPAAPARPIRLPHHATPMRTLALMRLLQSARRGWTYAQLAQHFDVTPRTIRRDLEALRAAGASIPTSQRDDDSRQPVLVHRLTWPDDEGRNVGRSS